LALVALSQAQVSLIGSTSFQESDAVSGTGPVLDVSIRASDQTVYVLKGNLISVFKRQPTTGALSTTNYNIELPAANATLIRLAPGSQGLFAYILFKGSPATINQYIINGFGELVPLTPPSYNLGFTYSPYDAIFARGYGADEAGHIYISAAGDDDYIYSFGILNNGSLSNKKSYKYNGFGFVQNTAGTLMGLMTPDLGLVIFSRNTSSGVLLQKQSNLKAPNTTDLRFGAASSDMASVYYGDTKGKGIAWFQRNGTALVWKYRGYYSSNYTNIRSIVMTPDNLFLYAVANTTVASRLLQYKRNFNGTLVKIGSGVSSGTAVANALMVRLSVDQANLYVGTSKSGVWTYKRVLVSPSRSVTPSRSASRASKSRSRSRTRSRSRSRSRTRSRSRSASHTRSRSKSASRSHSASRSPSRSLTSAQTPSISTTPV
jgi:6-phosphogluconolactonase (cycloisomerase 2 family)